MHKIVIVLILTLQGTFTYAKEIVYRVVMEISPPHQMLENNQIVGIIPETIQKKFDELSIPVNFEMYPWKRAMDIARLESNTFISNIARTQSENTIIIG